MNRAPIAVAALLATISFADVARAQCAAQPAGCRQARVAGTNPDRAEIGRNIEQIAVGPARYGALGWNFSGTASGTISSGPGVCTGGTSPRVPAHSPCPLLKAIFAIEDSWRQFDSTNCTLVSFDCGYGIGQVTSGMRTSDPMPVWEPARVASSLTYNASVGLAILMGKWQASPCIGGNDPDVIEDWYFATWAYNGWVYNNNPNNPRFDPARPPFQSGLTRGNYPYQELVWGVMRTPYGSPDSPWWPAVAVSYPVRSMIANPPGNIARPLPEHRDTCTTTAPPTCATRCYLTATGRATDNTSAPGCAAVGAYHQGTEGAAPFSCWRCQAMTSAGGRMAQGWYGGGTPSRCDSSIDTTTPMDSGVAFDSGVARPDTGVARPDTSVAFDAPSSPRDTGVAFDTSVNTDAPSPLEDSATADSTTSRDARSTRDGSSGAVVDGGCGCVVATQARTAGRGGLALMTAAVGLAITRGRRRRARAGHRRTHNQR
ncbi:MAG: hypothetical protein JNK05_03320 [Myxococcales bacterium]|nr:hypothetical protein [Myxococcales bacterium]